MNETLACLIIDDPLLRPQYGCLNFELLLEKMKKHNFFTEIAFIPWNYRRNDPRTVRLLINNSNRFAICIHGCNHTGNEYGGSDYKYLRALSATAMWRMEEHKRKTGLPYDPVIVFPQGRFSSVAMKAIKDQGYLAAFNSTLRATDVENLPSSEFQKPATTIYHGLPLFLRRYSENKEGLLLDMAAKRPIIIVEHHGAFRNGYQNITEVVDWINGSGNIKWVSLAHIVKHYVGGNAERIVPAVAVPESDWLLDTKVAIRRYLSEIRDNYVETNDKLTMLYKALYAKKRQSK